jgi:hypothetical protein
MAMMLPWDVTPAVQPINSSGNTKYLHSFQEFEQSSASWTDATRQRSVLSHLRSPLCF